MKKTEVKARSTQWKRIILVSAAVLFLTAGCQTLGRYNTLSVGDILKDPREYDGDIVRVTGTVQNPFTLLLINAYQLSDDTVNTAFSLGALNLVVIKETD